MTDEPVLLEVVGPRLTVTLNSPRRKNALNSAVYDALREAVRRATDDPDVRVLVLRGSGGVFSAGGDLAEKLGERDHPILWFRRMSETVRLLHEAPVPTVAQVEGVAFGAGWNLALACDLVVAASGTRFCQVFVRRGLSPDFGGSWLLPRIVGLQQAKRLALLAEEIDAEEAHRLGLVTYVVGAGDLTARVDELAAQLAAQAPIATVQAKFLLNEAVNQTLTESLASEERAQTANLATSDARSAFEAFLARKDPTFEGEWLIR